MARSMLPGRSLDPGSNARARGMITLPGFPGRQNSAYRPASAIFKGRVQEFQDSRGRVEKSFFAFSLDPLTPRILEP